MSDEQEPLPPELEELVRGMRRDVLRPEQVAEVARRLGPALGPGGGGPRGGGPGGGGGGASFGPGGWIAAGAVVIVVAISIGWMSIAREDATEPVVAPPAPPAVEAERPPASRTAPIQTQTAPEEAAPAEPEPQPMVGAPTVDADEHEIDRPRSRRAERASGSAEEEHTLLVEARRVLPSDPARALALADQHRARFASGALAPEREMIAIDALEALGRRADAEASARALVLRWPSSSYARRVRARGLAE